MGSPETELERQDDEGPQHLVQLQGFFMGQTPITQAQWRAVAQWQPREGERWERELDPSPSFFGSENASKDPPPFSDGVFRLLSNEQTTDQRPVECVDWNDAREFCARLRQRTGRAYTLPSEAQWEYACRAGSTTPFAFGKTLSADLANTNASHIYGDGALGPYRQQTTPVGMFPANAWGLYDMHGNVEEWCLDDWPGPNDIGKMVMTRGGSWHDRPTACRSAARAQALAPGGGTERIGFRVVCLPQGRSARFEVEAPGADWNVNVDWRAMS
jgi:formylglycine-generating enzyme required for sulfatase activity